MKVVRVVLISPPSPFRDKPDPSGMPLGLVVLSSMIQDFAEVTIIDGYSKAQAVDDVVSEALRINPDIAGISIPFTFLEKTALKIAGELKKNNSRILTIAGGFQASRNYEKILRDGNFDFVILNDGEIPFRVLVSLVLRGRLNLAYEKSIAGIALFKDGKILFEKPEQFDYPGVIQPDYDLLPDFEYESIRIETSRGCGFNCPYCATTGYWGNTHRPIDPVSVLTVLAEQCYKGKRKFSVADDNFNFNKQHARKICEVITRLDIYPQLGVSCRPELLITEDLEIYRRAGINSIFLGLESGSPEILKQLKRAHDPDKTREIIEFAMSLGIDIHASFMIGLPGETRDDIKKTLEYADSLSTSNIGFHIFHPLPGSEFGDNMEKYGITIENPEFEGLGAIGSVAPIRTRNLSSMEISDFYDRAIEMVRRKRT